MTLPLVDVPHYAGPEGDPTMHSNTEVVERDPAMVADMINAIDWNAEGENPLDDLYDNELDTIHEHLVARRDTLVQNIGAAEAAYQDSQSTGGLRDKARLLFSRSAREERHSNVSVAERQLDEAKAAYLDESTRSLNQRAQVKAERYAREQHLSQAEQQVLQATLLKAEAATDRVKMSLSIAESTIREQREPGIVHKVGAFVARRSPATKAVAAAVAAGTFAAATGGAGLLMMGGVAGMAGARSVGAQAFRSSATRRIARRMSNREQQQFNHILDSIQSRDTAEEMAHGVVDSVDQDRENARTNARRMVLAVGATAAAASVLGLGGRRIVQGAFLDHMQGGSFSLHGGGVHELAAGHEIGLNDVSDTNNSDAWNVFNQDTPAPTPDTNGSDAWDTLRPSGSTNDSDAWGVLNPENAGSTNDSDAWDVFEGDVVAPGEDPLAGRTITLNIGHEPGEHRTYWHGLEDVLADSKIDGQGHTVEGVNKVADSDIANQIRVRKLLEELARQNNMTPEELNLAHPGDTLTFTVPDNLDVRLSAPSTNNSDAWNVFNQDTPAPTPDTNGSDAWDTLRPSGSTNDSDAWGVFDDVDLTPEAADMSLDSIVMNGKTYTVPFEGAGLNSVQLEWAKNELMSEVDRLNPDLDLTSVKLGESVSLNWPDERYFDQLIEEARTHNELGAI